MPTTRGKSPTSGPRRHVRERVGEQGRARLHDRGSGSARALGVLLTARALHLGELGFHLDAREAFVAGTPFAAMPANVSRM
jgi:hypothetical protein